MKEPFYFLKNWIKWEFNKYNCKKYNRVEKTFYKAPVLLKMSEWYKLEKF